MHFSSVLLIAFGVLLVAFRKRVGQQLAWSRARSRPPFDPGMYFGVRGEERARWESVALVTVAGIGLVVFGVTGLLGFFVRR